MDIFLILMQQSLWINEIFFGTLYEFRRKDLKLKKKTKNNYYCLYKEIKCSQLFQLDNSLPSTKQTPHNLDPQEKLLPASRLHENYVMELYTI